MNFFIILVFGALGICFYFMQGASHENKIHEQIKSLGGSVTNIERKTFSTGPVGLVGKGRTVYRIEYRVGDREKEGWVKFGGFFGTDWRL